MFYNKRAVFLTTTQTSDGMGGWLDSAEEAEVLAEVRVANAPVSAELALKEYGIVTTSSMKLYTTGKIPEGYAYIHFEEKDYRVLQMMDYGLEKSFLVELME